MRFSVKGDGSRELGGRERATITEYEVSSLLIVIRNRRAFPRACRHRGAAKLTQKQRRRLRCYRNKHTGEYDVPKETCIREILYKLDAEAVENVVVRWMAGLDETELRCIAIDGKTLKGTAKRNEQGEKKGALHLVSAVNHSNARLLAQEAVQDKSNEIPAVRTLIERFPHLDGITVTTDAMHCLDETARGRRADLEARLLLMQLVKLSLCFRDLLLRGRCSAQVMRNLAV